MKFRGFYALGKCPRCKENALTVYRYESAGRVDLAIECSCCEIEPQINGISNQHALCVTYFKKPQPGEGGSHEIAAGFLEVGLTAQHEVVINHPDLKPDQEGCGHIVFSAEQALDLAHLLIKKAGESHELRGGVRIN
jgi:hypothetical protein